MMSDITARLEEWERAVEQLPGGPAAMKCGLIREARHTIEDLRRELGRERARHDQ